MQSFPFHQWSKTKLMNTLYILSNAIICVTTSIIEPYFAIRKLICYLKNNIYILRLNLPSNNELFNPFNPKISNIILNLKFSEFCSLWVVLFKFCFKFKILLGKHTVTENGENKSIPLVIIHGNVSLSFQGINLIPSFVLLQERTLFLSLTKIS